MFSLHRRGLGLDAAAGLARAGAGCGRRNFPGPCAPAPSGRRGPRPKPPTQRRPRNTPENWRLGGNLGASSLGVSADQKGNISELSLPEVWGENQPREAAGKGPRHTGKLEPVAAIGTMGKNVGDGRSLPARSAPLPLTSSLPSFSHSLRHLPVSTNSPPKSTPVLCLSKEDQQTLKSSPSGFLP